MDNELKLELALLISQQEAILENQQKIFNRLEVIEDCLELNAPSVETPAKVYINEISEKLEPETETVLAEFKEVLDFKKEPVIKEPVIKEPVLRELKPPVFGKEQENLEFKIGGTLLNRLGSVAIILGLSYFLKYSFDNHWIGDTGRIILGILLGLALLGVGEKLRTKYFLYSQGLVGAGSLALYFSVYAGYDFYHLIPPAMAFGFLIIIMANTVFTAVRHDSLTIGVFGIIGGYAAPLLISSSNPLPWVFFGYLAILTCGIMGVSLYKRWNSFRLISFVLNQVLLAIWMFSIYVDNHLLPSMIFVTFNFLAYLAIATGYKIKVKSNINEVETVLVAINALGFFLWSRMLLEHTFLGNYMGFYALAIALAYIYIGRLAYSLHQEDKKQVYILFAVAIKLVTIAIFLQLDYQYIAYGWILEAYGIFFIASQLKNRLLIFAGLIVLSLGTLAVPAWVRSDYLAFTWLGEALGLYLMGLKLDFREVRLSGLVALFFGSLSALESACSWVMFDFEQFLVNWPTLALALAIILAGTFFLLSRNLLSEQDKLIRAALGIGVLGLFFAFLTTENHHFFLLHNFNFFLSPEQLSLSILWMAYAIVLFFAGMRKNIKGLRYGALALIGIIILKAFFVDLSGLATVYKILLFIILGLFLLGISFVYQKKRNLFDRSNSL